MYPARYTVEVYVAKTGRRLTTFAIPSDEAPGFSCPSSVVRTGLGGPDVAQGVKPETLARHLRPFVMARRPLGSRLGLR